MLPPITDNEDLNSFLYNLQEGVNDVVSMVAATPSPAETGYLYRYLFIKYAIDNIGTGLSDSPTGKAYYGICNKSTPTESTNPTDYTWYAATFGTTNFLYYKGIGGRKIQFDVNTAPINYKWLLDNSLAIDLDNLVPDGTISGAEILNAAITELKLSDAAVTANKTNIAALSAITGQLNDNTVSNTTLADNAVTSLKIASNAVTANKTSIAAINPASGNLTANSVTAGTIAAGTIVANDIFAGTITGDKIAANTIVAGNILANTLTSNEISAGSITATSLATDSVTADKILAGSVTALKIDSTGLSIRDNAGNVILQAGSTVTPLDNSYITPAGGWLNGNITLSSDGTLSGAGGGAVTIGGLGYSGDLNATYNQSDTVTNASIATRLNKSAADVLTGPITMAASNSILVGTINDGLYLGNTGLVGRKAGANTFAIDAVGNATFAGSLSAATGSFAGSLSAATGSFAGSLSAATGTFAGTLTAAAINAVDTINIAGNAVTTAVYASGNGFSRWWNGYQTVNWDDEFSSISFSAINGDQILIEANWRAIPDTVAPYYVDPADTSPITARLKFNGVTQLEYGIGTIGNLSASSEAQTTHRFLRIVVTASYTGAQTVSLSGLLQNLGGGGSYGFRYVTISAFIRRR